MLSEEGAAMAEGDVANEMTDREKRIWTDVREEAAYMFGGPGPLSERMADAAMSLISAMERRANS